MSRKKTDNPVLIESIRRYSVGSWFVRVWRQQDKVTFGDSQPDVEKMIYWAGKEAWEGKELAENILELPNVNAVEVVDMYGAGVVLYKNWP
jgi:hypothetical protein